MSNKDILISIIVSTIILLSTYSFAEDTRKFLIDPASTAINGVKISTTESEIIKIFGKPLSVEKHFSELLDKPTKDLIYNWIKFHIVDGEIYGLSCTGKKCETNLGIRVGDHKSKVIEKYGKGNPPYGGTTQDSLREVGAENWTGC